MRKLVKMDELTLTSDPEGEYDIGGLKPKQLLQTFNIFCNLPCSLILLASSSVLLISCSNSLIRDSFNLFSSSDVAALY